MEQNELKQRVAQKALELIDEDMVVGVGSGSTVNCFIDALASKKHLIDSAVAASKDSERRLKELGIPVIDLNSATQVHLCVDGADKIDPLGAMIKGGGGALTREKILAAASQRFLCIVDESKLCNRLSDFPVAVEVIPMARSLVGRALLKLGGSPEYRTDFLTDNGNIILDVHELDLSEPYAMEEKINNIPGVVCNGIFANQHANQALISKSDGTIDVKTF